MTHTEYILTVKTEILEHSGREVKPVRYHIGDKITVDEQTFERLKSGEKIERFTQEGSIYFSKYEFENEVKFTQVTIEYGTRKLGQKKTK